MTKVLPNPRDLAAAGSTTSPPSGPAHEPPTPTVPPPSAGSSGAGRMVVLRGGVAPRLRSSLALRKPLVVLCITPPPNGPTLAELGPEPGPEVARKSRRRAPLLREDPPSPAGFGLDGTRGARPIVLIIIAAAAGCGRGSLLGIGWVWPRSWAVVVC